ncbi:TasA family protein [Vagococcus lutrae]|uniref:TasA family protein n=1 Tax=Enterococcus xiangfangensis TaxID=1296537 RepID=A0ABU3FDB4_9ENTE|nr:MULTISPECIES: TasA family protein [Enterococcaceae]MDT2760666.1 TasA family protein [Enterococcus xiangfangensis]MDT2819312.1 TasA family protein [Vagococcus lutrae]MDT2832042.1 TasA family protein [Vagococcus carniphilus]
MKKKLSVAALLVALLSLISYGTIAFFTAENVAHNVITTGNIDIELLEWADEEKTIPFPKEGIEGVMPGAEIIKIAEVKNTGGNKAYVRVGVQKEISLENEDSNLANPDDIQVNYNQEEWTLGADGFYYHLKALEPGEMTKPLFNSVHFNQEMGNIYQNSTINIHVTAYATQAANNGNNALEALGWPDSQ